MLVIVHLHVYREIFVLLNFCELDDYGHFTKMFFANLCCKHVVSSIREINFFQKKKEKHREIHSNA